MKISLILPAAGSGKRMGSAVEKQFLKIGKKTILEWTLTVFNNNPLISEIVLILPPEKVKLLARKLCLKFEKISAVIAGGKDRVDSVRNGFNMLTGNPDIVLIHDAVRPMVTQQNIKDVINSCRKYPAVTLAVPVKDTIKRVKGTEILETPDRSFLWHTQTPQGFKTAVLEKCLNQVKKLKGKPTDECQIAERLGFDTHVVAGNYFNIKITTPEDLIFAKSVLK